MPQLSRTSARRILLGVLVGSLLIAAGVGIVTLLVGTSFNDLQIKILITTLILGAYTLTALCGLTLWGRPMQWLGFLCSAVSLLGFLCALALIWEWISYRSNVFGPRLDEIVIAVTLTCAVLSFSLAHASLLLLLGRRANWEWVRLLTLAFIAIVAGMLISLILKELTNSYGPYDRYFRLLGVAAILDVVGTVLTPVIFRFAPRPAPRNP